MSEPWEDFQSGATAVEDAPWADFQSEEKPEAQPAPKPSIPVNVMDPDAGLVRSGTEFEQLSAKYGPDFAARAVTGQPKELPSLEPQLKALPWYEMAWGEFRNSRAGRALFGPTDIEKQAIASGAMPGPPGGDPGLIPLALTAPSVFGPSLETTAGKAVLGAFIAQNLKSQPERIAAINQKFDAGDTKGAYHDILADLIDTGMVAAGAHELHGEIAKGFETPPQRAARLIAENVDAADLGPLEPFAQAGGAGVTPEVDAALRQGYQPAPTATSARVPSLPGFSGKPAEPAPVVPETPAEPERGVTVLEEIRAKNAKTIGQIQDLYPKAQLNREQARELRNAAWGKPEEVAQEHPADEFAKTEEASPAPPQSAASTEPQAAPEEPRQEAAPAPKTERAPSADPNAPLDLKALGDPGTAETQIQNWQNAIEETNRRIEARRATLAQLKDPAAIRDTEHVIQLEQQGIDMAKRRIAELNAEIAGRATTSPAPEEPPVSKTKKPVDKPVEAAAKIEERVTDAAQTEGQRPAKEVKGELVERLESAVKAAPARADLTVAQQEAFGNVGVKILEQDGPQRSQYEAGERGLKKFLAARGDYIKGMRAAEVRAVEKTGLKRITIDIPGDGKFTVWNVKEPLQEVLNKAKALDTSAGRPQTYKKREISKEDADWVRGEVAKQTAQSDPRNTYFIKVNEGWKPTAGKSVVIPGFEEFEFFAHPPENGGKGYKISEATTGQGVGGGYEGSVKKAVQEVMDRFQKNNITPEIVRKLINNAPKSPRVSSPEESPKVARFGGGAPRARKVKVPAQTSGTRAPAVSPLQQHFQTRAAGVQNVIAPQTLGTGARAVANALRHFMGRNALAMARAEHALGEWRSEFDKTPVASSWVYDPAQPLPHNFAVIDALERDRTQLPQRYQDLADVFDKEFAWRIKEIQKFSPNALRHLITNYFPHVWQDPKRAEDVMAQVATRLFAGRKEFLKQRSLPFFAEGLAAGLKPISDNPVDLLMAKMHSMDKYILAQRAMAELRSTGAMKFKYLFTPLPEGWRIIDDPSFIVQKPPMVTIDEAFDQFQRNKLGEILQHIGITRKRVANLNGAWGEADYLAKEIRSQIGAHEPTEWHELGHQMDWKFPELRKAMFNNGPKVAKQLRALADLRAEGQKITPSYQRYLRKAEEKMAEIFRAYVHAPELFKKTAPDVLDIFNKWLDTQPFIRDRLNEMRNGRLLTGTESTTMRLSGMQQLGHWIMPDGPAQVIQNYLSPGLSRFGAYRTFRSASNILNAAQLGMSGFHLGFTSLDAATSRLALAIEDAARGDVERAVKTLASVPASPVTNFLQGRRMIKEALHPGSTDAETAALVEALEHAGGRVGQDAFWKTNFTRRMKRAIKEGTASGYLAGAVQAPFALIEQSMRPIMEYIVPRQKLGVFADMARRGLEQLGPNATTEQTREVMRKAWDSVDNRMGQLVYDNLFYNRAVKDLALLAFRAYGWQLGKYREGLGAGVDVGKAVKALAGGKRPEVTHRMAYAMALPLIVGTLGAIVTRLLTNRNPEGQDYFMPPTGEQDANGNPVRLNFPSYIKDVLAYSKHPVTSLGHSLNPMFSEMFDLYENKDFYNVEIRHPDDPLWKQGGEVAAFAAKQFVPFSVSGAQNLHENAAPAWKQVMPFFGITPAPSRMTMTPAQSLAGELMAAGMGDAPLTQEQFDKSKIIRDAVRAMKSGKGDGAKVFAEALASGKLNPEATQALMDRMKYTPLQFQVFHLGANDAMKVWRVASAQERAQLQPLIATKIVNSKALPLEQKQGLLSELTR